MSDRIIILTTVVSDTFAGAPTVEPSLGTPEVGEPWELYASDWSAATKGRKLQGLFQTSVQGSTGVVTAVQHLSSTPIVIEFDARWDTDSGTGAEGYVSIFLSAGSPTDGAIAQNCLYLLCKRNAVTLGKVVSGAATALVSESFTALSTAATHKFTIHWFGWQGKMDVYIDDVLTVTATHTAWKTLVGPYVGWQLSYTAADSTHQIRIARVLAQTDGGFANSKPVERTVRTDNGAKRYVLWDISPQGSTGWMHMMILKGGKIYAACTNGTLYQVDFHSGRVLNAYESIVDMTAPVVDADGNVWGYRTADGDGLLTKLSSGFAGLASYTITGGDYSEEVPLDPTTGYFMVRRVVSGDHKLSAVKSTDGTLAWTATDVLGTGTSHHNYSSPLIVGASVFLLSSDGTHTYVYKFANSDGTKAWKSDSVGAGIDTEYCSICYDGTNILGVTKAAVAFAVNASTGVIAWTKDLASLGYQCWATPSYYDGHLYVPLYGGAYRGRIAKLNATTGAVVWNVFGYDDRGNNIGEDCWNVGFISGRFAYRNTHGPVGKNGIVIQSIANGGYLPHFPTTEAPCTLPVASDGIVAFGNGGHLLAIRAGDGDTVDYPWHGTNRTGHVANAVVEDW